MPSTADLRRYCERHGRLVRSTNHLYCEVPRPDGELAFIKVSHGSKEISPKLWRKILKDLGLSQETFNRLI